MEFQHLGHVSPNLNKNINDFVNRLDMTGRDRELFYDIINQIFEEGKIKGKLEIIIEKETKKNTRNGKE